MEKVLIAFDNKITESWFKMNLTLECGRPAEVAGRLPREARCYELLDALGIEYGRVDHPRADTMEACAEIDEALGALICKNLFLCNRQATEFYMLMMPGDKVFKTKDLSAQIGSSRLSFASGENMVLLLDTEPGSLSVLSLMNDKEKKVRLLVDKDVLECELIGCHPCVNTSSLKLKKEDVFEKILPHLGRNATVVELPVYEIDG